MGSNQANSSFLIFWYTLTCVAVLLYLYGFFPIKSTSTFSIIDPPSVVHGIKVNAIDLYKAKIDRLIIIVIDALRMDFVNNKSMPYLTSVVKGKDGCFLATKAETPTVTMPRIKAITTGSVPQFIDIVLNLASTKIQEDSFLQRAKELGKTLVFYGDNTWLKLYPSMFTREEGTTSFYVTDFTEVDNNVTRNVDSELNKTDWSVLILHYLGLDHIGHVLGPYAPPIHNKLLEMDQIVRRVHESALFNSTRTAVLVCSDHGMRNSGGHGGSSFAETTVPLAVLGVGECADGVYSQAAQTDIAPTVSVLLGLPIPADSIGRVLPQLLGMHSVERQLYIYYYNALGLISKAPKLYEHEFKECFDLHKTYLMNSSDGIEVLKLYQEKLLKVSEKLVKTTSTQTIAYLYIACSILACSLISIAFRSSAALNLKIVLTIAVIFCTESVLFAQNIYTSYDSVLLSVFSLCMAIPVMLKSIKYFKHYSPIELFLFSGTLVTTLCLVSTSFIEEEHQIWYFLMGSLAFLAVYKGLKQSRADAISWTLVFIGLRVFRTFNQVGNMWANEPDVSDWLLEAQNYYWLQFVFIFGLIGVWLSCVWLIPGNDKLVRSLTLLTLVSIFIFRVRQETSPAISEARVCKALLVLTIIAHCRTSWRGCHTLTLAWTLWSTLLLRPYNVGLIPFCFFASRCINNKSSLHEKIYAHIWLSTTLFFCQGYCNALSSIDISPGYIGLSGYSPLVTTLQVVSHTYAFPILSNLLLFTSLSAQHRLEMMRTLAAYRTLNVAYFYIIMIFLRTHLFVWSVFSPKILIESCHSAAMFIFILLYSIINKFYN